MATDRITIGPNDTLVVTLPRIAGSGDFESFRAKFLPVVNNDADRLILTDDGRGDGVEYLVISRPVELGLS